MTPFYFLEVIYVSTAFGFLTATFVEGHRARDGWRMARIFGLVACIFWPAVLIAMLTMRVRKIVPSP